jgi:hypothetical protein
VLLLPRWILALFHIHLQRVLLINATLSNVSSIPALWIYLQPRGPLILARFALHCLFAWLREGEHKGKKLKFEGGLHRLELRWISFIYSFFSIVWCSHIGNHPQEELVKLRFNRRPAIFWQLWHVVFIKILCVSHTVFFSLLPNWWKLCPPAHSPPLKKTLELRTLESITHFICELIL